MEMTFILNEPMDMHLHLRDGDMLRLVAPLTSNSFSGALVMPNLVPPITTKEALLSYKKRIIEACKDDNFTPYMTLFFQNNYSFEFLEDIKDEIIGIKLYPAGITTNSETGVSSMDIEVLRATLENMSKLGIPLCIHGETNGFVMDREKEFMAIYESIASSFPDLKIIMEHITTKDAVELLDIYPNLYATVTLHHLLITLDDVAGGMLDPHLFCKPIAKRPEDRTALLNAALKAHPKLMFGSDSAPHPKHKKECCGCAAGVFTSPIALQVLVELFEKYGCLNNLNDFVSNNAKNIYGLNIKEKIIKLIKKDFTVPAIYEYKDEKVVPMYAGKTISWSIESIK
ncbi:dihydroorotase [Aliarcobacter cryaerophilus ATCC 43158]|uniref:Dihydroorotase n=1 Tax=Aliarcobacter cryaerophilus ATCC 43158 TaxID=1032070 RepID=A0AAD0TUQ1_9BACT|nr:dihydroorotase [Aliarcobacter cryaerophilus]AYJ80883.1 dihydroorotase, homodimeric type [Aliarcobacter cryaerophilus ATCC 43158]PRM98377.1 dihydroorotase [Aliarcobacter cryaerophilus]QCZ23209.1 dihydroorotase [Aliarcobacter cryaerophilus ATCC 43158]